MPKKPSSIIVHLRVRTDTLEGFLQYEPSIKEPDPVCTTSSIPFEEFTSTRSDGEPAPYDTTLPNAPGYQSEKNILDTHHATPHRDLNGVFICNKEHQDSHIYPRQNTSVCWWDGHPFDTVPVFIPKRVLENGSYLVYGNFSSPECAMAYLWDECDIDNETRWERTALLAELTHKITNHPVEKIRAALPRWALKEYGGEFTIEEFRRINTSHTADNTTYYPPITADIPVVRVKNVQTCHNPIPASRGMIRDERIRKAEKNLFGPKDQGTAESHEHASPTRGSLVGVSHPTQQPPRGLASMMNIRVVEPSTT